jgi:hypothetical protein
VAALDDRIGGQLGRNQVIETFHELGAGECLRDDGRPLCGCCVNLNRFSKAEAIRG